MPCSGCSALNGANPKSKKNKKNETFLLQESWVEAIFRVALHCLIKFYEEPKIIWT